VQDKETVYYQQERKGLSSLGQGKRLIDSKHGHETQRLEDEQWLLIRKATRDIWGENEFKHLVVRIIKTNSPREKQDICHFYKMPQVYQDGRETIHRDCGGVVKEERRRQEGYKLFLTGDKGLLTEKAQQRAENLRRRVGTVGDCPNEHSRRGKF